MQPPGCGRAKVFTRIGPIINSERHGMKIHLGLHRRQGHGKIRALHLTAENVFQAHARRRIAEDVERIVRQIGRGKKREALQVVPVIMRKQQRGVERRFAELFQARTG